MHAQNQKSFRFSQLLIVPKIAGMSCALDFIDLLIRPPRKQKQKAEPNMRALARRFEALNSLTPSPDSRCNAMSMESMCFSECFWMPVQLGSGYTWEARVLLLQSASKGWEHLDPSLSLAVRFNWIQVEERWGNGMLLACFSYISLAYSIEDQTCLRNSHLGRWTACPAIALDFVHTFRRIVTRYYEYVTKFHQRTQIVAVLSCLRGLSVVDSCILSILLCQVITVITL